MFGLGELKNVEVHTAGTVCVHGRKNCRVTDDRERGLPGGTGRRSGIDCAVGDVESCAFRALTVAAVAPIPVQSFDDVDVRDKAEVPLRGVDG